MWLYRFFASPGNSYWIKVFSMILAGVGWINAVWADIVSTDLTNLVSVFVASATTLAVTAITIRERWNTQARNRRRQQFADALEEQRVTDQVNRESLTAKVETLTRILETTQAEADDDRKHMRESLHSIKNELAQSKVENEELRDDFLQVTRQLIDANDRLHQVAAVMVVKELGVITPRDGGGAGSPVVP